MKKSAPFFPCPENYFSEEKPSSMNDLKVGFNIAPFDGLEYQAIHKNNLVRN